MFISAKHTANKEEKGSISKSHHPIEGFYIINP